jgi:hypothetical protein
LHEVKITQASGTGTQKPVVVDLQDPKNEAVVEWLTKHFPDLDSDMTDTGADHLRRQNEPMDRHFRDGDNFAVLSDKRVADRIEQEKHWLEQSQEKLDKWNKMTPEEREAAKRTGQFNYFDDQRRLEESVKYNEKKLKDTEKRWEVRQKTGDKTGNYMHTDKRPTAVSVKKNDLAGKASKVQMPEPKVRGTSTPEKEAAALDKAIEKTKKLLKDWKGRSYTRTPDGLVDDKAGYRSYTQINQERKIRTVAQLERHLNSLQARRQNMGGAPAPEPASAKTAPEPEEDPGNKAERELAEREYREDYENYHHSVKTPKDATAKAVHLLTTTPKDETTKSHDKSAYEEGKRLAAITDPKRAKEAAEQYIGARILHASDNNLKDDMRKAIISLRQGFKDAKKK